MKASAKFDCNQACHFNIALQGYVSLAFNPGSVTLALCFICFYFWIVELCQRKLGDWIVAEWCHSPTPRHTRPNPWNLWICYILFTGMIKLRILTWRDYPWLFGWGKFNHQDSSEWKREAGESVSEWWMWERGLLMRLQSSWRLDWGWRLHFGVDSCVVCPRP